MIGRVIESKIERALAPVPVQQLQQHQQVGRHIRLPGLIILNRKSSLADYSVSRVQPGPCCAVQLRSVGIPFTGCWPGGSHGANGPAARSTAGRSSPATHCPSADRTAWVSPGWDASLCRAQAAHGPFCRCPRRTAVVRNRRAVASERPYVCASSHGRWHAAGVCSEHGTVRAARRTGGRRCSPKQRH